jgi:TRAP-type C4-dicarboxylate transport system permease small subunit
MCAMSLEPGSPPAPLALRTAQRARRVVTAIAAFMNYVAGWGFVFCSAFVTFDVLARNFGGFSSQATTEITSYLLAFGIAWGLAHALATRSHIRIDVLVNRLPLASRQFLHAFALLLMTVFALFIAWCAWHLVDESILFNAKDTSALSIPLVIPQGLWFVGIGMLAAMALCLLAEVVCLLLTGRAAEIDTLLGPRGYQEETAEALEAVGLAKPEAGP